MGNLAQEGERGTFTAWATDMAVKILVITSMFFCTFVCKAQIMRYFTHEEDSICKYGKKYDIPIRLAVKFPLKKVSSKYKKKELHKAIPDTFKDDDDPKHPERQRLYDYYFRTSYLHDYDPKRKRDIILPKKPLFYFLRDTYFSDINGDGLLDFIHYPRYYGAIMRDVEHYDMFIQQKRGDYKYISFRGFIMNIEFNKDGTLNKMTTYLGPCCDDYHCTFYNYTFNKALNDLLITKSEDILKCQIKRDENNIQRKK